MNKDILDFIEDGMDYSDDYDWKTAGQVYGILSKFAFIANRHENEMSQEELDAFDNAEDDLLDSGDINLEDFKVLIQSIKKWTGSEYKLDLLNEENKKPANKEQIIKDLVRQIVDLIED